LALFGSRENIIEEEERTKKKKKKKKGDEAVWKRGKMICGGRKTVPMYLLLEKRGVRLHFFFMIRIMPWECYSATQCIRLHYSISKE
jgi:hypothetical protein